MPIEALLFDKDGTLFDFAATWGAFGRSFLARIANQDADRAEYLGRLIGFDMVSGRYEAGSVVIAGTPGEIADALLHEFPGMAHADMVSMINDESACAPQVEAVPLVPFFGGLRDKGYKLGVATNDGHSPAHAHLEAVGIRELFDFVAGFDSGHGAKPGPGQLLAFAAHVGIDPARIAMVGDSTHDLEAGRAAGMTTIGVLTGLAGAEDLSPLADVVLPNIGHIPDWLAA
ncbi:HAD family hydrolase [Ruegeria sediminis]|uniref:phosphoglycolate phosphatase n=1 Tax=Ruegeria sediminis TaxID=2583820 RepID=A0ABY2WYU3_9RHOB|nr:HAD family hydrolase [Ruegeria sediminis]TMV08014.1 HAD family hydrolase [Ruegeria sediminis]